MKLRRRVDPRDERFMRTALRLALRAEGLTNPNPVVGAVVVKRGAVVGSGYHRKAGTPHAEVHALRAAGSRSRGATLYVTLEPCDHFGRTPPCTEAIAKSGISRVVVAMRDPNPLVNGAGVRKLRAFGIDVVTGALEDEARSVNAPYVKYITEGMPFVTMKAAMSLDGKTATRTGSSRWISSAASRQLVQRIRSRVDAVMIGSGTARADDPRLLSREPGAKQPLRVVVDTSVSLSGRSNLVRTCRRSPVMVVCASAKNRRARRLEARGVDIVALPDGRGGVDLRALLKYLGSRGVMHVLVEGGGTLAASLMERSLVDRMIFFIAPKVIGGSRAPTPVDGRGVGDIGRAVRLRWRDVKRCGEDIFVVADVKG